MVKINFFHSIKTKLIFLITIVISAIALILYLYFPNEFEKKQLHILLDKINSIAHLSSNTVKEALYSDNPDAAAEQILSIIKNEPIQYLIIHTNDNTIFYQHNLPFAKICNYTINGKNIIALDNTTLTTNILVDYNGKKIGMLYLGYSIRDLKVQVREMQANIGKVSFIIFIVGVFFVFYISSAIINPLLKMVDIVEKIRGGNLSQRAPIIHNDEIGYLAKSFNAMVERIEDTNEEMESINKSLEKRVVERTKELEASKEKAEAAVRMKTEFLAQMSHEIRTPINSILSYTQLLKSETFHSVPEDLRFSFDMINSGGRRLIRTVDLILNMSELQTGTYEVILENCNIVEVLTQLVGEFQTTAQTKNINLMLINRLEKNETNTIVDIYTVTQIFANLIDNAIKYTIDGSIEVVAYKTKENLIAVDVQDTGIGISDKFQKTLFEPFTQEEQGYTRKFEGNGLGMALVKEYCKLNNASISVKSQKDIGSTFSIIFENTLS